MAYQKSEECALVLPVHILSKPAHAVSVAYKEFSVQSSTAPHYIHWTEGPHHYMTVQLPTSDPPELVGLSVSVWAQSTAALTDSKEQLPTNH